MEALFLNKQFKKASIYGYHTIEWMARCEERGVEVLFSPGMSYVIHGKFIFFHTGILRDLLS